MKIKKILLIVLCLVIAVLCPSCTQNNAQNNNTEKELKIALIPMSAVDRHWIYMKEGAFKAAEELGCRVDFLAPNASDVSLSIELLNNVVAAGYDAVLYACSTPDAPTAALREVDEAGIKIIYVDCVCDYPAQVAFVTDGYNGGTVAGKYALERLTSKGVTSGKIGLISFNKATVSCEARVVGFCDVFKDTAFEMTEVQYCDGDSAKAQSFAENYISQGVVAIFGSNEGSSVGVGNAIKASGRNDIYGFGFDTSDNILTLINGGYLQSIVYQKPYKMGYNGVYAAVDIIKNGTDYKGEVFDTGVEIEVYKG